MSCVPLLRCVVIALPLLAGCLPSPAPLMLPLPPDRSATWGGVGLGAGSTGLLVQVDLNRQQRGRFLRGRLSAHDNAVASAQSGVESRSLTEWSALVGRGTPCCGSNWGAWALGGGIVTGSRGSQPAQEYTTIGAAGEVFLVSGRWPHIAIAAAANINPESPVGWFSVSLLLGRMPFISVPGVPARRAR